MGFDMGRPLTVQLIQINNSYSNQYYIPFSVGILKAVAERSDLATRLDFREFVFRREPPEVIAERIGNVDVVGVSCYVWNWRLSVAVAERVRASNPNAVIIFGGPHVPGPKHDPEFLEKYPFVDLAVHGEGETTFVEILRSVLEGRSLTGIAGTSHRDRKSGLITIGPDRQRMRNLEGLPSPYLDGTFEELIAKYSNFEWMAIWETNRGCPFSCTFCDWGSATASKVIELDWDRLMSEIDWFSDHRIRYVFCTDANFGIRKRDIEIARALVRAKKRNGYPQDFRVCFTKNSTSKIFDLATTFNDAEMLRGISLSMQSLSETTLSSIKRDNISLNVFKELQSRYNAANISTFTELILGLPGETYDSFVAGIDELLNNGQHSQILIYNCTVMPNAEMGDPVYQKKHGIGTVAIPMFVMHGIPGSLDDPMIEREDIIVETSTMTRDEWRRMYKFGWTIQLFHTLGLLQGTAIALHNAFGIRYRDLYSSLLEYATSRPQSLVGREIEELDRLLDRVLAGIGFDQVLPQFSDVTWPAEEASLLRLSLDLDALYAELKAFLRGMLTEHKVQIDEGFLDDLFVYQRAVVVDPMSTGDRVLKLKTNIPECVAAWRASKSAILKRGEFAYRVRRTAEYAGDVKAYAKHTVWYGRKGGKFLLPIAPEVAQHAA
jgi:radical SAM superfamily enzyme YgiQ (UPF0313 family)